MEIFLSDTFWQIIMLLAYIGSTILLFIKNHIEKKATQNAADRRANSIEILKSAINCFIADAEKMKNYTGEEKRNFVVTRVLQIANGLMTEDQIIDHIESQLALTNMVNIKKNEGEN